MIEKAEHNEEDIFEDLDHVIPEKGEHNFNEADEEYVDAEHYIPEKTEHDEDVHDLPQSQWKPDFHAREEEDENNDDDNT